MIELIMRSGKVMSLNIKSIVYFCPVKIKNFVGTMIECTDNNPIIVRTEYQEIRRLILINDKSTLKRDMDTQER